MATVACVCAQLGPAVGVRLRTVTRLADAGNVYVDAAGNLHLTSLNLHAFPCQGISSLSVDSSSPAIDAPHYHPLPNKLRTSHNEDLVLSLADLAENSTAASLDPLRQIAARPALTLAHENLVVSPLLFGGQGLSIPLAF